MRRSGMNTFVHPRSPGCAGFGCHDREKVTKIFTNEENYAQLVLVEHSNSRSSILEESDYRRRS